MGERFKAIPASYVVLAKDNLYLLLRRKGTSYYDGYLSLPAGHVEEGESLKTAAIREAHEEVGIIIQPQDLQLVHVLNRPAVEKNGDTRIEFFFMATQWQGEIQNMEQQKCSELLWANKDRIPEDTTPEVKQALAYINQQVLESEMGWYE